MLEVLSRKTADGDKFPPSRELKQIDKEKKNLPQKPKKSKTFDEIRRSRLVQAYSNTREVNEESGDKQRRATSKECWAEALASRKNKGHATHQFSSIGPAIFQLGSLKWPVRRRISAFVAFICKQEHASWKSGI